MNEELLQNVLNLIKGDGESKNTEGRCEVRENEKTDVDLLDAYSRAVITVVDAVGPAVVSVSADMKSSDSEIEQVGSGSGVIIAPDGYILTNDHVVHKAKKLSVTLTNGDDVASNTGRCRSGDRFGGDPS